MQEDEPGNAEGLVDFARFCALTDTSEASKYLKQAMVAVPEDCRVLGEYANFLGEIAQDHDQAEALYKRAITADPQNAGVLGGYADFLVRVRGDHNASREMFKK